MHFWPRFVFISRSATIRPAILSYKPLLNTCKMYTYPLIPTCLIIIIIGLVHLPLALVPVHCPLYSLDWMKIYCCTKQESSWNFETSYSERPSEKSAIVYRCLTGAMIFAYHGIKMVLHWLFQSYYGLLRLYQAARPATTFRRCTQA